MKFLIRFSERIEARHIFGSKFIQALFTSSLSLHSSSPLIKVSASFFCCFCHHTDCKLMFIQLSIFKLYVVVDLLPL